MNGLSVGNGVYLYTALQVIFALQGCIHPFTLADGRTTNQDPGVTVHTQTLTMQLWELFSVPCSRTFQHVRRGLGPHYHLSYTGWSSTSQHAEFGDEVNTIVIGVHLKKREGGSIILLQEATAVRECCCHDWVTRSAVVQVIMSTRMAGPKASQLNITQSVTLPPPAFFMIMVHPQLSKSFKSMQVCNS